MAQSGEVIPCPLNPLNSSVIRGRIACALGVLGVLTVLFCPAVQGPYSAVHGPVTVFHAARAAAGARIVPVRAQVNVVPSRIQFSFEPGRAAISKSEFLSSWLATRSSITLRC